MLEEAARQSEEKRDLVTWIKRNFYIPETKNDPILKGRIGLEPYQEDTLREILSTDEKGNFKYSTVVWSDIKKSYKSTIAAAVNLARAWHEEWGEHYIIANDLKQADSRVAHYLRRAVQLNPNMAKKVKTPGYRINLPSGSFIEAIPIDPSGEAGTNADMITFSELWGANEEAKENMWAEMTIPPGKHGKAFRWVESYAGFVGESKLLYSLYETGVKHGKLLWPDKLYHVNDSEPQPLELYVNEAARMIVLWNTKPRCPTQTAEYYKSEASILLPAQFQRMHRNQWISSTETFVPMEWLYACRRTEQEWPQWGLKYMEGKLEKTFTQRSYPMVIAADAGVSDDNFGLWMGCRHPLYPDNVMQMYVKKWEPPVGGKIDFQGTEEEPGPEREIRRLIKNYNVVEVCYDPHQLHDMMSRLAKEELSWFKPFNQGDKRLIADSGMRGLIRDRKYWYRGEKDFEEHVQNSDAQIDAEETKIRIVKRADQLKVDLLVAASMGSRETLRLNL